MRNALRLVSLLCLLATPAFAQLGSGGAAPPPPSTLVKIHAAKVTIVAGASATAQLELAIEPTWHINANPPSPDYMIPTVVSLKAAAGVSAARIHYPAAQQLKVEFDPAPLSVYTQAVTIPLPLVAAATAENGSHTLRGTLRYQACNDQVCTAPTSIPFTVEVEVTGGVAAGAASPPPAGASEATPPSGSATATETAPTEAAPTESAGTATHALPSIAGVTPSAAPRATVTNNPIAEALAKGGLGAFLTLFLIGLALNLTPCVYPMFGVTVSIFGARSAAPTIKVLGAATVYVLGITTMYSVLGVVAALTGGLFGAFLQNPLVLAAIGVLLLVMSLSMFGVFELQPPAWLLQKLGGSGATNVLGLFVSGLVVGVFAAPCVGPPVVALLAVVAAKADPWFGFRTFFTLALGLGAPYLVLATSSNLLQKLPRSGDWMIWVKKLFGVILVALGLFYVSLSFAPQLSAWVAPAALLIGGLYLGFIEKSAAKRKNFLLLKRIVGVAGIAGGIALIVTAPKQAIEFKPYEDAAVQQALASGKPVILEFSASWCIPCHELERSTFSDPRVIAEARGFQVFKVDLTRSDSPEVAARTKQYGIQGVPTVIFLNHGAEVTEARFSGFLPPEQFLEKMKLTVGKQS